MTESIRDRVANALYWTTEQMAPGRGQAHVRISSMYLDDIQKHTRRGDVSRVLPRFVFRVWYIPDDSGGSKVSCDKKSDGIFVLLDEEFLIARSQGSLRTVVEGGTLVGCRAEPVTALVKGTAVKAFRIAGAEQGLYALDPRVGNERGQTEYRDRLIGRVNGEVQAGPAERDIPGPGRSAVMRLVGRSEDLDLRNPRLDANGLLEMGTGEKCLYHGRHRVIVARSESSAYGTAWQEMPGLPTPGDIWITNRRVAASWPDWSRESVSTLMQQRRNRAGYPDAAEGIAVAGHLTWAWISAIFVGAAMASSESRSLEFQATDRLTLVRFRILEMHATDAERLLREAAASVAAYRLQVDNTLDLEEQATLGSIQGGEPQVAELSWGKQVSLPSSFKIGRDPSL